MKRLKYLGTGLPSLNDDALAEIARISSLESFYSNQGTVTATGITALQSLKFLSKLKLVDCKNIDDTAISPLKDLKTLRELEIKGTTITDAGFEALKKALPQCVVTPWSHEPLVHAPPIPYPWHIKSNPSLFTLVFVCLFTTSRVWAIDSPLDIGSKSQLVADRTWIQSSERVSFTPHPAKKHPGNPLMKADQPWEGWRINLYGNVLFDEDEKLFKMWYVGDMTPDFPTFATFYATSTDGIRWSKPPLGMIKSAKGLTAHNAVADSCLLASVIKDKADPNSARRYKMIAWVQKPKPEGGPHTFVSPDGLRWTRLSDKPICRSNDVITGYYDEERRLYVAFPKLSTMVRGQVRRCFGITTSKDFLTWPEPRYIFQPDQRDDAGSLARIEAVRPMLDVQDDPALMRTEFYGVGVYVAESCTLAFPWVFTINNNARYGNHEGPGEIQLAVSRDLDKWDRPFRNPVVPRGKPGEWDSGFFTTPSRALRVGDEVWLYYGGANYTHGTPCLYREEGTGRGSQHTCSIGLATWKLDRFVSADVSAESGTLTTVPVRFNGTYLELNAATKPGGHIIVEIRDPAGQILARSKPATGDDLRLRVDWERDAGLEKLAGKPVTLRFELTNAQLFAFAFRSSAR